MNKPNPQAVEVLAKSIFQEHQERDPYLATLSWGDLGEIAQRVRMTQAAEHLRVAEPHVIEAERERCGNQIEAFMKEREKDRRAIRSQLLTELAEEFEEWSHEAFRVGARHAPPSVARGHGEAYEKAAARCRELAAKEKSE